MPRMKTESWSTGNFTWIASTTNIHNNRTESLRLDAFTEATHYPNGFIPSGTPLAVVGGDAVPYNAAGLDGSEVLAGHLFNDLPVDKQVVDTHYPIALFDTGKVWVNRVPGTFAAPAAANDKTQIIYL